MGHTEAVLYLRGRMQNVYDALGNDRGVRWNGADAEAVRAMLAAVGADPCRVGGGESERLNLHETPVRH